MANWMKLFENMVTQINIIINMQNGKPAAVERCTMCYHGISHCPQKPMTLLGEKVTKQCQIERYM